MLIGLVLGAVSMYLVKTFLIDKKTPVTTVSIAPPVPIVKQPIHDSYYPDPFSPMNPPISLSDLPQPNYSVDSRF